jgi:hypothetical protein
MPGASVILDVSANTSRFEAEIQTAIRRIPALTIPVRVNAAPLGKINGDIQNFSRSMEAANARLLAFSSGAVVFTTVGLAFKKFQ